MHGFLRVFLCVALCLAAAPQSQAAGAQGAQAEPAPQGEPAPLRIGVLKYGTVNWELAAMTEAGLDVKHGVEVEIVPFAGENATAVALQAREVDMVVSDWLWVSRQREAGADFVFAPYSSAVGSMMVAGDSDIQDLGDLEGRTLGIAGGPLDKNWLLIQALAERRHGLDLAASAEIVFAAPPLLTQKALSGELDAVLNYWHYAARLEAQGFRTLISGTEAAMAMGATGPVASVGWVFSESFAEENPGAIEGFLKADAETKELMRTSDAVWEELRPLVQPEDDATLAVLRERYREGIPDRDPAAEAEDIARLYDILAEIGGPRLLGPGDTLAEGTYWRGAAEAETNGG